MPVPRGGGDLESHPAIGRWAGNRIALVGDYAEDTDLPLEFHASKIYGLCDPDNPDGYADITDMVAEVIEDELQGRFVGKGWKRFVRNEEGGII
jgi:hypothetical protein